LHGRQTFQSRLAQKTLDAIFIDEAGHAVEPEAVAVFTAAQTKQLVIAGDPKQLGPVVRSRLANRYGLKKSYLERLVERTLYQHDPDAYQHDPDALGAGTLGYENKVITKLVRNYRSHPDIFYEGHLQTCQDKESEAYLRSYSLAQWSELPVKGFPFIFNGIEGKNEREANSPSGFNIDECVLAESKVTHRDIGIVPSYAKQVEKLTTLLRKNGIKVGGNELMIGSEEKFQGQERRVIIVSTVRSSENFLEFEALHNLGFVSNPKRFNVATRTQALLIIVGNARILAKDRCWGELRWMGGKLRAKFFCQISRWLRGNLGKR
jgi:superfamily I DNA and/or RNA helicase